MNRRLVGLFLLFVCVATCSSRAQDPTPKPESEAAKNVKMADDLVGQGKPQEAIAKYQAALKLDPQLESAHIGLTTAHLDLGEIDAALASVLAGMNAHPESAPLMVTLGKVRFRRGEMGESEQAFQTALQIDPHQAGAYIGLARLYRSFSLYGHADAAVKRAHEIAPNDGDVQFLWLQTLPRQERLPALEAYLASPQVKSYERKDWQEYLQYLKKTHDQPSHSCKVVNNAEAAQVKLEYVHDPYPHIEGVGVDLKVNGRDHVLLLDTGAGGITIDSKSAKKAGLKSFADIALGGVGSQGERRAYLAVADRIQIGGLEFQDCVVTVSDKRLLPEADGLIGADVFASYMVDIDMPRKMLKLSALPARPGEQQVTASLDSEDDSAVTPEASNAVSAADKRDAQGPKDRYIAPDMANWTRVFRFGHMLLVPTRVNASKPMLFLVDTGSFQNILTPQAVRANAKLKQSDTQIYGASGKVDTVYNADKVDIEFARFHQTNIDAFSVDLSNISDGIGTEVSGTLGFNLLSLLQVKIDYRDGLVDFVYRDNHGVEH